jgi:hypothetical protein
MHEVISSFRTQLSGFGGEDGRARPPPDRAYRQLTLGAPLFRRSLKTLRAPMNWLLAPFLAFVLAVGAPTGARSQEPAIWFNPLGSADFLNLFTRDAPWKDAAKKVKVLVLVHWWVANKATDDQLIAIRDFAREHHMEIDLSTEAVAKLPNPICGNEEGYTYPGENGAAARILHRLGIKVDWLDMDAPINSGSYDTGPQSCQLSIPDLITRTVMTLKDVVALYPDVKIMDVEPIPSLLQKSSWRQDVSTFHRALTQQLGAPVLAMQADVSWQNPAWQKAMVDLSTYVHEQRQMLSIIYNGSALAQDDRSWINTAVQNFEAVEGILHIVPDHVLFTTWDRYPTNNLSESASTAQTWLINRYQRPQSTLQVEYLGESAKGRLLTLDGRPIANAVVKGFLPGVSFAKPLPVTVVRGVVPFGAKRAVIIVRVNAECGVGCNGMNDLLFGAIRYQETAGGSSQMTFSYPATVNVVNGVRLGSELVGGAAVTRVTVQPGQTFAPNSARFAVTAGAQYQLNIPAATVGGLGWSGVVGVVWVGDNGEMGRATARPDPGRAMVSTAVTAKDGTFDLLHMPRNLERSQKVTVEFDGGDSTYRPTVWTPFE